MRARRDGPSWRGRARRPEGDSSRLGTSWALGGQDPGERHASPGSSRAPSPEWRGPHSPSDAEETPTAQGRRRCSGARGRGGRRGPYLGTELHAALRAEPGPRLRMRKLRLLVKGFSHGLAAGAQAQVLPHPLPVHPPPPESPSAPVNVTVRHLKANSAVVSWDVLEDEVVIGFAISQQKKDVRMLRFIQEVNTTTRSCALWDLEEDTEYIVHVQAISIQGQSPASEPVLFKTPREAEKMASKSKDEVTMKEMGRNQQLRTGEVLIIVVVLFMWAGVIALFCRQYDIIKDNEPNNNKDKAKSPSETSTPEHQGGGLLRSKFPSQPSASSIQA
ncbi:fibronectin type III domain-containing protein 5 [Echinops telfairi]|uniref:Fibronectin type III domain-containing protein 5 n=1 Tax=Echinops telfairi TaxID=9371 RepID=A0ABM1VMJ1_ECHTE|nr:fibronectin type III domain-containing protein 5 [Echinops telfairi]